MKKHVLYSVLSLFALSVLLSPQGIQAAPYYQGKRITMVVGFAPGGEYDRMTRLLVKYLPKYIPGKPTFIVDNMPGGSSIIAANYVFNISKPDGMTIGSINQGLQIAQLVKTEGMQFDLRRFAWIGSTASEATTFCIRGDLSYKTFTDLKNANKEIFMSAGGPMTVGAQFGTLIKEFIKLNLKVITYTNFADALLAVERKEVDGTAGTYGTFQMLIESGALRPLLRGRNVQPGIENLPVDEDLTPDKIGKKIMSMRSATDKVGKPYVVAPGTPKEVMSILRNAFAKAAQDPQLQADAKKNKLHVEYLSAEESLKAVNYLLNQPDDIVNEFKKYIKY